MSPFVNICDKLLEKFISYDPTMDKDTTVTMELDQGDYSNLNKLFLNSIKQKEKNNIYIPADEIELANQIKLIPTTTSPNVEGDLKASYIDNEPDLMIGVKDKKIYYYDESSGVITEMPINSNTAQKVTLKQLKTILRTQKVDKSQVDNLIRDLENSDDIVNSNNDIKELNTNNESLFKLLYSKYSNGDQYSLDKSSKDMPNYIKKFYELKKSYTPSIFNSTSYSVSNIPRYIPSLIKYSNDDQYSLDNSNKDMPNYMKRFYQLKKSYTPSKISSTSYTSSNDSNGINILTSIPTTTNSVTQTIPTTTNTVTSTVPTTTKTVTSTVPSSTSVSRFKNIENFTNQNLTHEEENLIKKAKLYHNEIEITAVGFVSVIIILFLVLIFWSFQK
jgi:hypothetical protein